MKTQKWFATCVIAVGLLGLSACTKNKKEDSAAKVASGEMKTYVIARSQDPRTLDPHAQFDTASGEFVVNIFDSLVGYHYLKRPYELIPILLTKMPEVSKDGKVYTFELKKGVKFHDDESFKGGKGRELKTDDVLYSLKRFADANINVNSWFMLQGTIEGLDDYRAKTKKMGANKVNHLTEAVSGLKKIDDYNFVITLTKPNPLFLYGLAATSVKMVAHEVVSHYGDKFRYHPIGTGPFKLKKYRKKQTMVLEKNENYHMTYPTEGNPGDREAGLLADAGKKLPLVDEIRSPFIAETMPEMLKFQKGELYQVGLDKDNFIKMAEKKADGTFSLKGDYAKKFNLYTEPSLSLHYMIFNMKDSLIGKNKLLRQAIGYAIDVDRMIEVLRNGRGYKLNTLVPLPIAGSERQIGSHSFTYNPKKAKELLAKAGYPAGKGLPELRMSFRSTTMLSKDSYEFFRSSLDKIGITLKADFMTFPKYLKAMDDANFQLADSGWYADYPDAENFFQLLYGPNKAPGPNNASFANKEYDSLYKKSKYMKNSPERFEIFKKMNEILKEEAPVVLLENSLVTGMVQKWVRNFKRNEMVNFPYKYINVDSQRLAKGVNAKLPN